MRPAGHRGGALSEGGEALRQAFWKEVTDFVEGMDKKDRLALMAELALGRHSKSPFGSKIEEMRARLDGVVRQLGLDPGRRGKDRATEIAFRRLKAWAELVEDADTRYLGDMASTGVALGTRGEILREEGEERPGGPYSGGLD